MRAPTIGLINYCNYSCKHCLVDKSVEPEYMEPALFEQIIRQMKYLGFQYAGITGSGEISLHPKLDEIFMILVEHNIDFEILNNGSNFKEKIFPLLKNPAVRKRIYKVGFSLDSSIEEVHDANRQNGSFKKILESIALCRLAGIPFYVKTALTNNNKNNIKDDLLYIAGMKPISQSFLFPQPSKRFIENEILPDPEEIYNICDQLILLKRIIPRLKVEGFNPNNNLFSCNAFYKFGIDEKGNYIICSNLSNLVKQSYGEEVIGNIKETELKELIIKHMNFIPKMLEWRFERKEEIKKAPLSLCTWCFYQFNKLEWLTKNYPESPWTKCLNLTSMD